MNKFILLVLVLVSLLVLSGCVLNPEPLGDAAAKKPIAETGKPECKAGQIQPCTTSDSCPGTQNCINKKWGLCIDTANDNCPAEECTENWSCTFWGICINGVQTRICVDDNNCGTTNNIPDTNQYCGECINGQTENCTTSESCPGIQTCANNLWGTCIDAFPNDNCPAIPEPYITVSQISPVTDMNYPVWQIFSYTTNVTCHDGNCGEINSTIYFVDANQTMIPHSGTPFYTINANPQVCSELHSGETCTNTWQVIVTGTPYNTYPFFVEYNSFDANISSKTTPIINITIDSNSS